MGKRHYIREWRLYRGLSQEQLAARLGISRPQLSRIESSARDADLSLLANLARELECEPADLIIRDPSDPEGIWGVWDRLGEHERAQLVRIAKSLMPDRDDG